MIFKALTASFEMHPALPSIPITFPSRTRLCCSNIKGALPCSAEPPPRPCSLGYFQPHTPPRGAGIHLGSWGSAVEQPWGEVGSWVCRRGLRDVIGVVGQDSGWTDGGWRLCCSPPHTLVGCPCWFIDLPWPVLPSPGSHEPWLWVEFRGPRSPLEQPLLRTRTRSSTALILPANPSLCASAAAPRGVGRQITSGSDSIGSFGLTWLLLPPPKSPASTYALEEALKLICAIVLRKP